MFLGVEEGWGRCCSLRRGMSPKGWLDMRWMAAAWQQPHFSQFFLRKACPPMGTPWCEGLARKNFSDTVSRTFLEGLLA